VKGKSIYVKGAREHNLKSINVAIPRDKLVVVTGVSGSGKSSLAFDTLYAEGQRRYVESLSSYARQFLGLMEKPDVDYIEGLSPAVSIEQRRASKNPRSTVGTVTEVYDYMRLLFARVGEPHCPKCGKKISYQTKEQITDHILELPLEGKILVLAPVVRGRKGEYQKLFDDLRADGYTRLIVDREVVDNEGEIMLDKNKKHDIAVVVDEVKKSESERHRILEAVEAALSMAKGLVEVSSGKGKGILYSEQLACADCGVNFPELAPRMFSFNSPHGACPECQGLGSRLEFDPDLIIPDKSKSITGGAIAAWGSAVDSFYMTMLRQTAQHLGFRIDVPVSEMREEDLNKVLYGAGDAKIQFKHVSSSGSGRWEYEGSWEGIIPNLARRHKETQSEAMRERIQGFMSARPCTSCEGDRLKRESLSVLVGGKNIAEVSRLSIAKAFMFFSKLELTERQKEIARQILTEILNRLSFLVAVGLDYLTLDRTSGTLSGGEAQRIRLATQIGSQLVGVLYILDEPSIGLHQKDNARLIDTLKRLRDLGNTVLVVEHDRDTIMAADHVIDLGPGAGVHGGKVVASGTPKQLLKSRTLTGEYLSCKKKIPAPEKRRTGSGRYLTVRGARCHNLKNIDVTFPLGTFTCVTGVSGSGKSTLINETLARILARHVWGSHDKPGGHDKVDGLEHVDKVGVIDQSPIGRTPRSNPATYTGVFTPVRDLFASLPEAKVRGYAPGRFSFNVKGGRCEKCQGAGTLTIEMHFLPDVYVTCDACKGRRFNEETLEVRYKGKSIYDVLEMTVEEALAFFERVPVVARRLQLLADVGLGYIKLGQPATTLSGGEAQRVKIVNELAKKPTGSTVYILDEPTTGLHFDDVAKLLEVLNRLVEAGNTVIVIEHNLDVVKNADHVIDLGPDGGDYGGRLVACGPPEAVAKNPKSYTGRYLKDALSI